MRTALRYRCAAAQLLLALTCWTGLAVALAQESTTSNPSLYEPDIPRTWADEAVASFDLPLARPEYSPVHVSERFYYQRPIRTIWKSYPIYHPDHEPPEYRKRLAALEPQVLFDESELVTEQDWIDAGAHVFRAPLTYDGTALRPNHVLDAAWYAANQIRLSRDGVFPYARWVIREKGRLEVGNFSCAMCHTRLMADGSILEGAQGNLPFDRIIAHRIRSGRVPLPAVRMFARFLADVPWVHSSPYSRMLAEELADIRAAIPPGVLHRQGTAHHAPVRVPDLIGIRHRKYLDATGLVRHRGIADLMRYAASNQGLDVLARFGDFVPIDLAPPSLKRILGTNRYSDAQLFALAKYLYSLQPPPNPNSFDKVAARGKGVFEREDCARCHTPPHYTNHRLTPVDGFSVPGDHPEIAHIDDESVGTDPGLALQTRRGTGFYKVASLRGLWYRGPLGHGGAVATLEDWFDNKRLLDDYVPTGWKPANVETQAVPGHEFGLDLSPDDRKALIAFLLTL